MFAHDYIQGLASRKDCVSIIATKLLKHCVNFAVNLGSAESAKDTPRERAWLGLFLARQAVRTLSDSFAEHRSLLWKQEWEQLGHIKLGVKVQRVIKLKKDKRSLMKTRHFDVAFDGSARGLSAQWDINLVFRDSQASLIEKIIRRLKRFEDYTKKRKSTDAEWNLHETQAMREVVLPSLRKCLTLELELTESVILMSVNTPTVFEQPTQMSCRYFEPDTGEWADRPLFLYDKIISLAPRALPSKLKAELVSDAASDPMENEAEEDDGVHSN